MLINNKDEYNKKLTPLSSSSNKYEKGYVK
jgi:hypothetical protein